MLEPGCGVGHFIGHAPANAHMVGVELDPITAAIASALYPDDEIRAESFTHTTMGQGGYFDAAVGNVPFGTSRPYDPVYNRGNHTIHNYFINKALAQTRPGGLVAFVTSHHTMDAKNPGFRRELYARADLVGAVRLPSGAHRASANTDVVTDLLILRRRADHEQAQPFTWECANEVRLGEHTIPVNEYFLDNPDRVLGTLTANRGLYGAIGLEVANPHLDTLGDQLATTLDEVVTRATTHGLVFTEFDVEAEAVTVVDNTEVGRVGETKPGVFTMLTESGEEELRVPKNARDEMRALLNLRDLTRHLLAIEHASLEDTPELTAARANLRSAYDQFVATYGYLNTQRETWRKKKGKDGTIEEVLCLSDRPAVRAFRNDPFAAITLAIEAYDQDDKVGKPAGMLRQRQIGVTFTPLGADTPDDALAISLAQRGRVDLDYVAYLLAVDPGEVRELLGSRIFDTPTGPVMAADYLSGDVRTKLDHARQWATDNPDLYQGNVQALEKAQPADIPLADIEFGPGTPWLGVNLHREFFEQEILGMWHRTTFELTYNPTTSEWKAVLNNADRNETTYRRWSTERRDGIEIFNALLNHSDFVVTDTLYDENGNKQGSVVNHEQSALFAQKGADMREAFIEWVWKDADRVDSLQRAYNDRFNRIVPRDYSHEGARLEFPGLASSFTPYDHQRAAVARMISQPSVGLFHEVGAGKTMEMVMGAMELRRLGLARKPMIVVPNHMLFQFANEWQQAYPNARVLIATKEDLDKKSRATFFAKATANEWDGIVITGNQFEALGLKPENKAIYLKREIADLQAALASPSAAQDYAVRKMEEALRKAKDNLAKALDTKTDPGLTFEDLGVDYLMVDEAHLYKNLKVHTRLKGINASDGVTRAQDLHMKIEWLRSIKPDGNVLTLATATPIANSITEAHTMLRYLRPDILKTAGIEAFDAFASTFTQEVTKTEADPAGGFRQMTRIAKFQNLPEFLALWQVPADVKTADELNLKVPLLRRNEDGQRTANVVTIDSGRAMTQFSNDIEQRSKAISQGLVQPHEDNMLLISTHGRRAAIDLRLVGVEPSGDTKLGAVADNIMDVYERTKDNEYLDALGETSATRGGLQLVFIDFSSPNSDAWNAYDGLADELVARGMDRSKIAFIHDATNDRAKDQLFAKARSGRISVLIGSTQKMGVGTNIQTRAVALHHVDAPWRPADIAQREGRIIRQGNQNSEVDIYRYVTERSFDTYMWQTLERKQHFINQVMANRVGKRVVDDIGDTEMSYAHVKAAATGDPLVIERVEVEANVQKYRRLERGYRRELHYNNQSITAYQRQIDISEGNIDFLDNTLGPIEPTRGDQFRITVYNRDEPRVITERATAASELKSRLNDTLRFPLRQVRATGNSVEHISYPERITLGGVNLRTYSLTPGRQVNGVRDTNIIFSVDHRNVAGKIAVSIPLSAFDGIGGITRLENFVESLPARADQERATIQTARDQIEAAQTFINTPFRFANDLTRATERLEYLDTQIAANDRERELGDGVTWPEHTNFYQGMSTWPRRGSHAEADRATIPVVATYHGGDTTWEVMEIDNDAIAWGRVSDAEGTRYEEFSLKDLEEAPDPTNAPGGLSNRPWVTRTDIKPDPATPSTDPHVSATDAIELAPATYGDLTRTNRTDMSEGFELATYTDPTGHTIDMVFLDPDRNETIPAELRSTTTLAQTQTFIYGPCSDDVRATVAVPLAFLADDAQSKQALRAAGYDALITAATPMWQRQAEADFSRHFAKSVSLSDIDGQDLQAFMHTYGIPYSPTIVISGKDDPIKHEMNIDNLRTHYMQPSYLTRPLPPEGGFTQADVNTTLTQWLNTRDHAFSFAAYADKEFADSDVYAAYLKVAASAYDRKTIDQMAPVQWQGQPRMNASVVGFEVVTATYGENHPPRTLPGFTRDEVTPSEQPATTTTTVYILPQRMSQKIPEQYRSTQRVGEVYIYHQHPVATLADLPGSGVAVEAFALVNKTAQDKITQLQATTSTHPAHATAVQHDEEATLAGAFRTQFGPIPSADATAQPATTGGNTRHERTKVTTKTPHR